MGKKTEDPLEYERLIRDLTWAYPSKFPETPYYDYCGMYTYNTGPVDPNKPPVDEYNKTYISKYPFDYPKDKKVYCRILAGDVRFFNYHEEGIIRDEARVRDFPILNSPEFYRLKDNQIPIIPSGTYIDILRTQTHIRREETSGKLYYYIMCSVKVNENKEYNPKQIVNEKDIKAELTDIPINRGQEGYIWHMFMGADESSPVNIAYMNQSGAECKSGNRLMRYYHDYSITLPDNENPRVTIAFKLEDDGRKKFCLGKVMKADERLFTSLYRSGIAQDVNVKEIYIGSLLRIEGSEDHKKGRACDINHITTNDGKEYLYTVGYNKKKGVWDQPWCPEAIERFEKAFMAQTATERVWGPWSLYDKTNGYTKIIPNMIHRYPAMLDWPSEGETDGEKLLRNKYIPELIVDVIDKKRKMVAWIDENGNEVLVKPGDKNWVDTIFYHYTHRHHGHYTI